MQMPTMGATTHRHRGFQVRKLLGGGFELMAAVLACEEENPAWNVNDQRVFGESVQATKKFVQHAQHLVKFENFVFREGWLALREGSLGW